MLFGATGDLAKRKLFPALYHLVRRGELTVPVIGVARSDWTDDDFRQHARDSVIANVEDPDEAVIKDMCSRLDLIQGDYAAPTTWQSLADKLDHCGSKVAVYYMAIPPDMFPTVAEALASVGLNERGRIVVEKPFGRDLQSAIELNKTLHSIFPEERIFRIDHYLGKEAVEDLLVFRFSNMLLEPVWNRNYVRSVQVTMAESIGVEGRGSFYEGVGAIRDVLQNHLLQVVTLLAMEPPADPDSSFLQDEKAKVLAAMEPIDRGHAGPRPVHRLPRRAGRRPPLDRRDVRRRPAADRLVAVGRRALVRPRSARRCRTLGHRGRRRAARAAAAAVRRGRRADARSQPHPLPARQERRRHVRAAGQDPRPAPRQPGGRLGVDFAAALGERHEAYERLLNDAIDGNPRRFAREDVVERTWRSCSRRSTSPARSTRTSATPGARPKPTASSTATAGSNRPEANRTCPDPPVFHAHGHRVAVTGAARRIWPLDHPPTVHRPFTGAVGWDGIERNVGGGPCGHGCDAIRPPLVPPPHRCHRRRGSPSGRCSPAPLVPGPPRVASRRSTWRGPRVTHGVQSGDVSADGGIVWTRADRPSRMLVDVSTRSDFRRFSTVAARC